MPEAATGAQLLLTGVALPRLPNGRGTLPRPAWFVRSEAESSLVPQCVVLPRVHRRRRWRALPRQSLAEMDFAMLNTNGLAVRGPTLRQSLAKKLPPQPPPGGRRPPSMGRRTYDRRASANRRIPPPPLPLEPLGPGARFIGRIFTAAEIAYVERKANKYEHYAARFAAKEAGMKAIGSAGATASPGRSPPCNSTERLRRLPTGWA